MFLVLSYQVSWKNLKWTVMSKERFSTPNPVGEFWLRLLKYILLEYIQQFLLNIP